MLQEKKKKKSGWVELHGSVSIPELKMFESTLNSKKQHHHETTFPGDRSMHVLASLC